MLENLLNSKVDWECGIGANPLRKQRFIETEMLRKFCLGNEYSSMESELRAPLTWRVKNNQGLKFRIAHHA